MNEDFVSFSLAKKLKEKGFREEVNAYYGKWENLFDVHPALDMNDCDYRASAPTISQILKWLREEKKIHVLIAPMLKHSSATYHWGCEIYDISRMPETVFYKESLFNMSSHNEAALSGIKYVIDNLI